MAKKAGAPVGNQNAKRRGEWVAALRRALAQYEGEGVRRGDALRCIADRVVADALAGDQFAIQEIGNRLDGKPAQAVETDGGGKWTLTWEA